jgi:gluconate 2-dehydrogenase alpha chain
LLLSGIGTPYDPATGQGTLGKNLTHQVPVGVGMFFEKPLNRFMGAASAGLSIGDFEGDVIDNSNLPFLRGGALTATSGGAQPISSFGGLPRQFKSRWGAEWKKASMDFYDRAAGIQGSGEHIPYRSNYIDLDPTYKDSAGEPLLRLTINWRENDRKLAEYLTAKAVEVARALGVKEINPTQALGDYNVTRYSTTHLQGGTIMSSTPDRGRRKSLLAALATAQSIRSRRLHVPESSLRKSHAHNPGPRVPRRRCHRRSLFEKTGIAGVTPAAAAIDSTFASE